MTERYSMVIQWSDSDQTFMVTLPEFDNALTHGDTLNEAVRQGRDLIASCVMWREQDGRPLPPPRTFDYDRVKATTDETLIGT